MENTEWQYSAWALQTERSGLRQFFQDHMLADTVELPPRRLEDIKRSCLPAKRDSHINLVNWHHLISFCLACGSRREELRDLRVRDVSVLPSGQYLTVRVVKGKGEISRSTSVSWPRAGDPVSGGGQRGGCPGV